MIDSGKPSLVSGTVVSTDAYPWFARATTGSSSNPRDNGCHGSLISAEYVLTAAQCISDSLTGFQIGAQTVQYFSARTIITHPNYKKDPLAWLNNDFALVRLNGSSSIAPVGIDDTNVSNDYPNDKGNLWVIGLGNKNTSGEINPDQLSYVEVKYVSNDSCCYTFPYGCQELTKNMMCATYPAGRETCQGDSGGPLYDSSSAKLVGVVSISDDCGPPHFPGVYARIGTQFDWIKNVVCNNHSPDTLPSWCGGSSPLQPSVPTPLLRTQR